MGAKLPFLGHESKAEAVRAYKAAHPTAGPTEISRAIGVSLSIATTSLRTTAGKTLRAPGKCFGDHGCLPAEHAGRPEPRPAPAPMRQLPVSLPEPLFKALVQEAMARRETPARAAARMLRAMLEARP